MTTVYIDGDIIAYRASSAAEKRSIVVEYSDGSREEYSTRTEWKKNTSEEQREGAVVKDVQTPEDVSFACYNAKSQIQNIIEACDAEEYFIVLSGKNNFRLDLPLPTRYKSNRKENVKPLLLGDVEQYLLKTHEAIVTDGYEADDYLSMMAYEGWKKGEKIIQATLDKDALQCNGWIYNWTKHESPTLIDGYGSLYRNEKGEVKGDGAAWLMFQTVFGDTVDGYRPADLSGERFGEVATYNLLKDCKSHKMALKAVYGQYMDWYPSFVTYKAWDGKEHTKSALDIMQMYFDCARMLRWQYDYVDLREVFDKIGIKYE